ncbi:hypothetical protein IscW_ISCW008829 [Ixodes scapularis]|uniref:Uncharacterized protein n=1 Tax=Ixodes scapularis TaxID=6945 RepID=B7PXY4_IXOSC|nr:hypothetical protein IscW_ISCW008829 [Ixodes scapularis]|eukprot:XP_002402113.1 hypothetical protein IscW_ISCW008829 [Ixodes scapularis]
MKAALLLVVVAIIVSGKDHFGARTSGNHDAHRSDHRTLVVPGGMGRRQHRDSRGQQVKSGAAVTGPSRAVMVQTVLVGQIINFPVIQTAPQPAVASTADVSNRVSYAQQQVMGNLTSDLSTLFSSVVKPVAALLRDASLWLHRTSLSNVSTHQHTKVCKHAGHIHGRGNDSRRGARRSHGGIGVRHGVGQASSVSGIPVLIIKNQAAFPEPSIAATLPNSFSLSPIGGQFFLRNAATVSGSQFFSFPVPGSFLLGDFLAGWRSWRSGPNSG